MHNISNFYMWFIKEEKQIKYYNESKFGDQLRGRVHDLYVPCYEFDPQQGKDNNNNK